MGCYSIFLLLSENPMKRQKASNVLVYLLIVFSTLSHTIPSPLGPTEVVNLLKVSLLIS